MTAQEILRLHPDDLALWLRVEKFAWQLAKENNLPLRKFSPLPKPRTFGWYGICYTDDKHVQLAVRSVVRGGKWYRYRADAYLITTMLCHELAHLVHPNHGPEFLQLHAELMISAVKLGIAKEIIDLTGNSE